MKTELHWRASRNPVLLLGIRNVIAHPSKLNLESASLTMYCDRVNVIKQSANLERHSISYWLYFFHFRISVSSVCYFIISGYVFLCEWHKVNDLCLLTGYVLWPLYGCFPFTSPRRQHRRQTRQRFFTLPKSPAGDALSVNANIGNAGDTGFAG